ncbi:hypothetical protein BKA69DRAFT_1058876 [Paraphysoderma sedebokerense]|nr:hypothetical protein BKA69DRAFT_1058876 [Paraphysoderma sedebokerense]
MLSATEQVQDPHQPDPQYGSSAVEELKTLVSDFHEANFYHQTSKKTYVESYGVGRPATDTTNSQVPDPFTSPLNPKYAENEVEYFQALFSQLKFNYLEQDTKEKFLKQVLTDIPIIMDSDEVATVENEIANKKRSLKSKKDIMNHLKALILDTATDLGDASDKLHEDIALAKALLQAIENLTSERRLIEESSATHDRSQLERAENELHQETSKLMDASNNLEQLQSETDQLAIELERLQNEIDHLKAENESARSAANSAALASANKNDDVQHLCSWYSELAELYWKMLGIQSIESISPSEIVANYKILDSEVNIHLTINPETGAVIDGRLHGLDSDPISFNYCPTQDLFGAALSLSASQSRSEAKQNMYVIHDILNRVKACERRRLEIHQLENRFPVSVLQVSSAPSANPAPLTISVDLTSATGYKLSLIAELNIYYPLNLKSGIKCASLSGEGDRAAEIQNKLSAFVESHSEDRTVTSLVNKILDL